MDQQEMSRERIKLRVGRDGQGGRTACDRSVLEAAYSAWMAWGDFRRRRARSKAFTYGRQWGDITTDDTGRLMTEGELASASGKEPLTNNMLRQLIKCVVGRFRNSISDEVKAAGADFTRNCLDELDSRALEEFLISGFCAQRVEWDSDIGNGGVLVENVNASRFFTNVMEDARGRDCEIVGCLHDVHLGELIMRLADGNIDRACRIGRIYKNLNSVYSSPAIGADSAAGRGFWHAAGGKYRAIEVWTLEISEVLRCHDCERATYSEAPLDQLGEIERENAARRAARREEIVVGWGISKEWHCRWFAPDGSLLRHFLSPFGHCGHPFVMKLYPLTDGEVHSFIEDVIDQQKYVNRLITIIDHIMASSAKGVLLYPEKALPDGYTWHDVRRLWSISNSIIPYSPDESGLAPQQIVAAGSSDGVYRLLEMQMRLIEQISGVGGVLSGTDTTASGVELYQARLENATVSLADIYGAFATFRQQRDSKAAALA